LPAKAASLALQYALPHVMFDSSVGLTSLSPEEVPKNEPLDACCKRIAVIVLMRVIICFRGSHVKKKKL